MRVMSNFDFLRNDDEIDEGSYASVPTKRFCAPPNVVSATAGGKEHLLPNIGNTETLLFCHFCMQRILQDYITIINLRNLALQNSEHIIQN